MDDRRQWQGRCFGLFDGGEIGLRCAQIGSNDGFVAVCDVVVVIVGKKNFFFEMDGSLEPGVRDAYLPMDLGTNRGLVPGKRENRYIVGGCFSCEGYRHRCRRGTAASSVWCWGNDASLVEIESPSLQRITLYLLLEEDHYRICVSLWELRNDLPHEMATLVILRGSFDPLSVFLEQCCFLEQAKDIVEVHRSQCRCIGGDP